ncbi:hypothetical protein [Labilibaculum sp.]|uniref:hypothetical protein n=1 Tax=Labilibaculum sp. TaxID=2060723 RepID=UPI00356226FC
MGSVARIFVINIGTDSFTANTIFWIFILLGIIAYVLIAIFLDSLYSAIVNLFFRKKESIILSNKNSNISKNLEKIRIEQQKLNDQNSQIKKKIAIKYIQKEFAAYCSDEDLDLLCKYVTLYAEKHSLQDIKPLIIDGLSNLDFYHFGWNIWKHFKVGKQEEVSSFLKTVFENQLKEVEIYTIKSHLKDDEQKGIIKIRKVLRE